MAATTLSAILERFDTVLQASPLLLLPTSNPFSDAAEPNANVGSYYTLLPAGLVHPDGTSNYSEARIDRITVKVQKPLDFNASRAIRELQDLCDAIERAIIADGPDHFYDATVEKGSRKVTRPKPPRTPGSTQPTAGSDLAEATIAFLVDYDYNEA